MLEDPIRERVLQYKETKKLTNVALAKKLGYSPTVISLYLSPQGNRYPGDLATLKARIVDLLDNESRRRASGVDTIDCEITKDIRNAIEVIRRTNDIGVIIAEPGEGKTRGIERYREQNPTCVLYHVRAWSSDRDSVEGAMMDAAGKGGYDNRTKRAVFLVQKFLGSDRPIIIDDAHKLTRPALQWFFDFHDETGVPIALIGTFSLEDKLRDDAQRFSRVGYRHEVRPKNPAALLAHLVETITPKATGADRDQLIALSEQVAEQHGHFRSVYKQLKLTAEIKDGAPNKAWDACFRAAHQKLIRESGLN
jgi:DNA transposition AAA+ family ATPase